MARIKIKKHFFQRAIPILPIKKKWFDMIKSGEKTEEYREIKPYWTKRFYKAFDGLTLIRDEETWQIYYIKHAHHGSVLLRNGYRKNAPMIFCDIELCVGYGKKEWGANPNQMYYILKIKSIEEVEN